MINAASVYMIDHELMITVKTKIKNLNKKSRERRTVVII